MKTITSVMAVVDNEEAFQIDAGSSCTILGWDVWLRPGKIKLHHAGQKLNVFTDHKIPLTGKQLVKV